MGNEARAPQSGGVSWIWKSGWLAHSVRTATGAGVSLAIAKAFGFPEPYWAAITTIVVMESTLGAAWTVSKKRLIGTALGAALGGALASYFEPGALLFAAAVFVLGLVCAVLRLDKSAYRFAGITVAIIILVAHVSPPWRLALHRFLLVSLGIAVALVFAALWPEREPAQGH